MFRTNKISPKIKSISDKLVEIIARTTLPNVESVVFDPLMGTGAYLSAALKLGRRVIGVDNDKGMYNRAKANLVSQLES